MTRIRVAPNTPNTPNAKKVSKNDCPLTSLSQEEKWKETLKVI